MGPTAESGWGQYSLAGNPSLNRSERSTVCPVWLGQESTWHLGPEEFQGKIQLASTSPRRRQWHPTPELLPGKSHGWRSLVGCSPWGCKESDTTSLSLFPFMHWRRKWQPTPVFLPEESQGWGNLVGGYLWGRTESDTTEAT